MRTPTPFPSSQSRVPSRDRIDKAPRVGRKPAENRYAGTKNPACQGSSGTAHESDDTANCVAERRPESELLEHLYREPELPAMSAAARALRDETREGMTTPCSPSQRTRMSGTRQAQVKSPLIVGPRLLRGAGPGSLRWRSETRGEQFSMVDQESATYRPRRAYIEPDVEPAQPERPVSQPGRSSQNAIGTRPARPPVAAEDHPKPLYRDDTASNGWPRPASRMAPSGVRSTHRGDHAAHRICAASAGAGGGRNYRRSFPAVGRASTALKPSTRSTTYDDDERTPLGRRAKIALLIGAVAAVVVIGLVVGYAVLVGKQPQAPAKRLTTCRHWESRAGQSATAVLTDDSMLSPSQAKVLDRIAPGRSTLTTRSRKRGCADRGLLRWRAGWRASPRHNKRSSGC